MYHRVKCYKTDEDNCKVRDFQKIWHLIVKFREEKMFCGLISEEATAEPSIWMSNLHMNVNSSNRLRQYMIHTVSH